MKKIKTAFIMGEHPYDVPYFQQMFNLIEEIEIYPQSLEMFATSPKKSREMYDVVIFYNFHMKTPAKGSVEKTAMEELGNNGQGILILHHALLAYPDWPLWSEICGIGNRKFGYYPNEQVPCHIEKSGHPITAGLSDFVITDETYTMDEPGDGSEILITTNNKNSMKNIGWIRQYKKSKVFCYESGHDNDVYSDKNFREIIKRASLWLAERS